MKSKKSLKRLADKLFSQKVRSRGMCQLEGLDHIECSGQLQTMHIISRRNHRLRWDTQNALCGCSGHHFWYTNNPWDFVKLIEKHFGRQHDYLEVIKNEIWDRDIEEILKQLT